MSDYSVKIEGIDELVSRLDAAGKGAYLQAGMEGIGQILVSQARNYPPVPEGSMYRRTNKLRNSWVYGVDDDGARLVVGNFVEYAPYVMGRELQTRVHAWHGWKTIEGIVQSNLDKVTEKLKSYLQKVLDG